MKAMTITMALVLTAQLNTFAQETKAGAPSQAPAARKQTNGAAFTLPDKPGEKAEGAAQLSQSDSGTQHEKDAQAELEEMHLGSRFCARIITRKEEVDSHGNVVRIDGTIESLALGDTFVELATNALHAVDGYIAIHTKHYGVVKMKDAVLWLTPSQKAEMVKLLKKDQPKE